MKFTLSWAGQQPMIKQHLQMERYRLYRHVVGNVPDNALIWATKGYIEKYFSEESIKKIQKDGKKLLDPQYAERLIEEKKEAIHEYWRTAKRIRRGILRKAEPTELILYAEDFQRVLLKIFAYFITSTEAVTYHIENELKKELNQNEFITLTTPIKPDLIHKEKKAWLDVVKKPTKRKIQNHMLQFPWLFCNIESEQEAFELMRNKLKQKTVKQISKEIKKDRQRRLLVKKKQSKLISGLSPKVAQLSSIMRQLIILRLGLKSCWSGMHFYLMPFFNVISQESGHDVKDIMMFYSTQDIIKLFESGKPLEEDELKARREHYLLIFNKEGIRHHSGDKAKITKEQLIDEPEDVDLIKGTVANKGHAIGKVKLVKTDDLRKISEIANTLTKEDILVTGMTNPNMVPLIEKVGAIVTDEGGMACHAAIISREFNIPCIVGCRIATKILKDREVIEVDANNGIIKTEKKEKK